MAALQGFPDDFIFEGAAVANMYRHIGDAVPPLLSYQIAHVCHWMLTGIQPPIEEILLPQTHLCPADLARKEQRELFYA
jgi:DNA (cytosine-5)-methyltransferase 1